MAKKLTALQKRQRKEKERKEREAYQRGGIKPQQPKGKAARRKAAADYAEQQRQQHAARKRSAKDVSTLTREQLKQDLHRLFKEAESKYQRLVDADIVNKATHIFEDNFAGLDIDGVTVNEMRAKIAALKQYLKRKDLRKTRAKKTKKKMEERFFKDWDSATDAARAEFWELWEKFLELHPDTKKYAEKYIEAFMAVYVKWKQNPNATLDELFENAWGRMLDEYESGYNESEFAGNPFDA